MKTIVWVPILFPFKIKHMLVFHYINKNRAPNSSHFI